MTPEPQKEYIITEGELEQLQFCDIDRIRNKYASKVRSRPYNPQQERERVLSELQEMVAQHYCDDGIHRGWVLANTIDRWISKKKEELRSRGGGGG